MFFLKSQNVRFSMSFCSDFFFLFLKSSFLRQLVPGEGLLCHPKQMSQPSALPFLQIRRKTVMKSEQMKSNKTGSHITIRAPNGHWHGSNLFFLCFCRKMGKSHQLQTHKKRGKKQVVILPEAQLTASTKKMYGLRRALCDRGKPVILIKKDSSFVKKC